MGSKVRSEFFFSSRRRHTIWNCDWSSDVCSSDLWEPRQSAPAFAEGGRALSGVSGQPLEPAGGPSRMEREKSGGGGTASHGGIARGGAQEIHRRGVEIGRASCRERGERGGGAGGV